MYRRRLRGIAGWISVIALMVIWLLFGGPNLPDDVDRPISHAIQDGHDTIPDRIYDQQRIGHAGLTSVYFFNNCLDGFLARTMLTQMAERSIDTLIQHKSTKRPGGSSKATLHARPMVFDRKQVFVGSLNLAPWSLKLNTEMGVILTVPELAEQIAKYNFSCYVTMLMKLYMDFLKIYFILNRFRS